MTITLFGSSVLLSSSYAVMLSFVCTVLLAYRAIDEENLLITKLEGYHEYQKKVPYRLLPFVW